MPVTTAKEFVVVLENRPGTLADLGIALGKASINIRGFLLQSMGDFGLFRFVTSDAEKTEEWLKASHYAHRVREAVVASIVDKPGAVGRLARKLSVAGVNIEATYHVFLRGEEVNILFALDDVPAAIKALG